MESLPEKEPPLVVRYGVDHCPIRFDGEDLECEDLVEVRHWVAVYTELLEFTRSVLVASAPEASVGGDLASDPASAGRRALMLQAQVQELHLRHWTGRLQRLCGEAGTGGDRDESKLPTRGRVVARRVGERTATTSVTPQPLLMGKGHDGW